MCDTAHGETRTYMCGGRVRMAGVREPRDTMRGLDLTGGHTETCRRSVDGAEQHAGYKQLGSP